MWEAASSARVCLGDSIINTGIHWSNKGVQGDMCDKNCLKFKCKIRTFNRWNTDDTIIIPVSENKNIENNFQNILKEKNFSFRDYFQCTQFFFSFFKAFAALFSPTKAIKICLNFFRKWYLGHTHLRKSRLSCKLLMLLFWFNENMI